MKQALLAGPQALEIAYMSYSRALAVLDRAPVALEVDGVAATKPVLSTVLWLPRGQHLVRLRSK